MSNTASPQQQPLRVCCQIEPPVASNHRSDLFNKPEHNTSPATHPHCLSVWCLSNTRSGISTPSHLFQTNRELCTPLAICGALTPTRSTEKRKVSSREFDPAAATAVLSASDQLVLQDRAVLLLLRLLRSRWCSLHLHELDIDCLLQNSRICWQSHLAAPGAPTFVLFSRLSCRKVAMMSSVVALSRFAVSPRIHPFCSISTFPLFLLPSTFLREAGSVMCQSVAFS